MRVFDTVPLIKNFTCTNCENECTYTIYVWPEAEKFQPDACIHCGEEQEEDE